MTLPEPRPHASQPRRNLQKKIKTRPIPTLPAVIGDKTPIANHIDFPDYSVEELLKISKMMLEEQQYQLTPAAELH